MSKNQIRARIGCRVKDNYGYVISVAAIIIILSVALIRGESLFIPIHDNLEDYIVRFQVMKNNHLFWEIHATAPMLGGLDRNYLTSDLKAYLWLYMLMPTYIAYIVGFAIKIALSVVGSAFLGKTILEDRYKEYSNIIVLCGLAYGLAPNYPAAAFGFASLPLFMAFVIRLYKSPESLRKSNLLFFLLYPVLSDLFWFGIFLCGYLVAAFIIDALVSKKPKFRLLLATLLLSLGYIVVEWRLVYLVLFVGEQTIRETMVIESLPAGQILKSIAAGFGVGHYHSAAAHTYIVLPVCATSFVTINLRRLRERKWRLIFRDPFTHLLLLILFNAIIFGIDNSEIFKELVATMAPTLKGISMARTLWFNGFLWYFAFAIALCRIKNTRIKHVLLILALFFVVINGSTYNHISLNTYEALAETGVVEKQHLSYSEFYSTELFDDILGKIDYKGEWSVAYGMHPAVLEYNGIATLDGYCAIYPEAYKERFRRLIAPELEVDEVHRAYYDDWGGRAYIFSNELEFSPSITPSVSKTNLLFDAEVFRQMGGRYVFSRVEIVNASEMNLELVGQFSNMNSPYNIFVYTFT